MAIKEGANQSAAAQYGDIGSNVQQQTGAVQADFNNQAPEGQQQANQVQQAPQQAPSAVESIVSQNVQASSLPQAQQRRQEQPVQQSQQSQHKFDPTTFRLSPQAMAASNAPASPVVGSNLTAPTVSQAPRQSGGGYETSPSGGMSGMANANIEGNYSANQPVQAVSQERGQKAQEPASAERTNQDAAEQTAENPALKERRQQFEEDQARADIRTEGIVEKPAPMNLRSKASKRFRKARKFVEEKVKKTIHGQSYSGTTFYETIFSNASLWPHEVSIGTENLRESLREPNSTLLKICNEHFDTEYTAEEALLHMEEFAKAINESDIEVTLEKTPVNVRNSIQVRTLRVHWGRGIGLHPSQTKAYNADFDGDPAFLNFDQANLNKYPRAMTQLIDIEGNPTIDPDFFPIEPIDATGQTYDDLRKAMGDKLGESIANKLIDYYIAFSNVKSGAELAKCWTDMLRRIDEIATMDSVMLPWFKNREESVSYILKSIYDFSIDRRGLSIRTQTREFVEHSNYNPPDPDTDPFVSRLVDITDEVVAGRAPMNFEDFTLFFHKYYGEVGKAGERKNVPFRLLADYAKAINRTDLVSVGSPIKGIKVLKKSGREVGIAEAKPDDEVSLYDLWQFTSQASVSKMISGRMHMGSHELAVSTQVRSMVLKEVGLPQINLADDRGNPLPKDDIDRQYREWIDKFVRSYNTNMRMLNIAQVSFRQGMMPSRGNVNRFDGISDDMNNIAEALVKVYGDFTVGRMFPMLGFDYGYGKRDENDDYSMVEKYRDMPLSRFVMQNRFSFKDESETVPIFDKKGNPVMRSDGTQATQTVKRAKFESIGERFKSGEFFPMDVLMKIADRRSSQLGDYREKWEEATKANCENFDKIADALERDKFGVYANEMLETMHLMSPRLFDFFGMDSPLAFAKSKWGKRLLSHSGDVEAFRSDLVSMMIEHRLHKASKILTEMKEIQENQTIKDETAVGKLEKLDAAYNEEMQILGSSSMVWSAIVSDITHGAENSTFRYLVKAKGEYHLSGGLDWDMYAADFWKGEQAEKYGTLLAFLKSDAPYQTKMAVLADVTRVNQQYAYMSINEVIGQLAHNSDPMYSGARFEMDKGVSTELDYIKESIDRISSGQTRSPEKIRREARKILDDARKNKMAFEQRLLRFATDPGYHVHVNPILAADAIASIFDKTYADSEKIKQQAAVNGYFGAVSLQRSGGFYTHLQQTDNSVLNMVGFDQITIFDIVKVLGNPDIELHVYDEFGCEAILSREELCGGNTIDDVIKYLERHPRVAMACRRHLAGVNDDVDGTARLNAMSDNSIGDNTVNRVFALLDDRPKFLAISSLCTPSFMQSGRNLSQDIGKNIERICGFIAQESIDEKNVDEQIVAIEKFLGIGVGTLSENSNLDEQQVQDLYVEVVTEIIDCIELVRASGTDIMTSEIPDASYYEGVPFGPDYSSIPSYYDARQQISGARTATMIGIEGSETKKNLALKEYLRHRPDRFMTIGPDTPRKEILALEEALRRPIQNELEASDDGTIVIEVPQGWDLISRSSSDETLEHSKNKQIGSIAKFLEVKREKGAETFNAKSKKYGDDGLNSMIKFLKYTEETLADGEKLRRDIDAAGSKDAAIPILAQALIEADRKLGYIDIGTTFSKSDYYNRADLMLVEEEINDEVFGPETVVRIRTLEQLSVALRSRLSDEAMNSEDTDMIYNELEQIVGTVGTSRDVMHPGDKAVIESCVTEVSPHSSIGNRYRVDRAMRQRSSSVERNYDLIYHIMNNVRRNKSNYVIPPRERIVERSNTQFKKLPNNLKKKIKGIAFPKDKYSETEQRMIADWYGDREYIYDYLGQSDDNDTIPVPGPQSLILFRTPPNLNVNREMIDKCKMLGMTAAFDSYANIPETYRGDAIELGNGLYVLPFFDMMLNGCVSEPIVPAPSVIPINPDMVTVCVEDTTYEIKPGDATAHMTHELADRVRVNFTGEETYSAYDLFPTVLGKGSRYENADVRVEPCSREEVWQYIVNKYKPCTIDYGVMPTHSDYAREQKRYEIREREYIRQFESAGEDSMLQCECGYDSIIGYVKLVINDSEVVFAPIVPFHIQKSGKAPTKFKIDSTEVNPGFDYDPSTNSFVLRWRYSGGLDGQYIKFFEGIGASNKMMASPERIKSRKLDNGIPVDLMYSTKSVASRLFASNKRINTMVSLMMIPRIDSKYAYNFGELDGAFPGKPEVAEALRNGQMKFADWQALVDEDPNIRFHADDEINAIVGNLISKCLAYGTVNPSILLATKTNAGMSWPMVTEFEAFLETGYNFQNGLMKLMYEMTKDTGAPLCPPSIDADSSVCLFKPVSDLGAGQDYGVLQMLVPHYDREGRMYKVPENVYLSFGFFGEEFSGFKKVNIDGFNRSIDSLNVSNNMNGFELSQVMALGRRDYSSVAKLGSGVIQAAPDAIMEDVLPREIRLSPDELYDRILSKKKWGNILTLTGHRPDKLFGYDISDENYGRIAKELIEYCKKHNIDTIVSGMALGFDQVGAQAALDAGIKLVAAVPFEGQESTWRSKEDKERYNEILARADLVVYVSSSKPRNKSEAARMLNERNEWMIHNGDSVYALYNGDEKGGTANAVRYAENMGKKVHKKNPYPMDTPEEIMQQESIERMDSHPRYKDVLGFALRTFHPDYGSRSTNSKETWDLISKPLETIIVHGAVSPDRLRDVLHMGYNGKYSPKELRQALISMTLNDTGEDIVVDSESVR